MEIASQQKGLIMTANNNLNAAQREEPLASQIIHGDCLAVLSTLPSASVDAVVTDSPFGFRAHHRQQKVAMRRGQIVWQLCDQALLSVLAKRRCSAARHGGVRSPANGATPGRA